MSSKRCPTYPYYSGHSIFFRPLFKYSFTSALLQKKLLGWDFYAPFMGIMFSGLCVRPSVPFQVKVLVKIFGRGSFCWSWSPINLKLSKHVPYNMIFLILMPKLEILSHFYGPLNIENDSADGASVYWGHILVYKRNASLIDSFITSSIKVDENICTNV